MSTKVLKADGSEYTVEAFKGARAGPGTTSFLLPAVLTGNWRRWKVRARPWPHKLTQSGAWTTLVRSEDDAIALCEQLRGLIESGNWRPADGNPPGIQEPP